jgi:hypothetical protein
MLATQLSLAARAQHIELDRTSAIRDDLERTLTGAIKDDAWAREAWKAYNGDAGAFLALSPPAAFAFESVTTEARDEKITHTFETFCPRFNTAIRKTRGTKPKCDKAGNLVRRGQPKLRFAADGTPRWSAERQDERTGSDGKPFSLGDWPTFHRWSRGEESDPERAMFAAIERAVLAGMDDDEEEEAEPLPLSAQIEARNDQLRQLRQALTAHVLVELEASRPPPIAFVARSVQGQLYTGAVFSATAQRRVAEIEAALKQPPVKEGRRLKWPQLLSEPARRAFELEELAAAYVARVFEMLGVKTVRSRDEEKNRKRFEHEFNRAKREAALACT